MPESATTRPQGASDTQVYHHRLGGCRPTPLAHYLKGLGILRLLAEQKDPTIRGWWSEDVFHVTTILTQDELEDFFLVEYSPTPILAPWNGGSGFFPKDNKVAIEAIESSVSPRFEAYRKAIAIGREVVSHLSEKPNKGDEKNEVIAACRRNWRGGSHAWIDASLALGADGESSFPALLGTGGNDGRLDFTVNFMQRLISLFDCSEPGAPAEDESGFQLRNALWNTTSPTMEKAAIGQFYPGAAGGPNGGTGYDGGIRANPWDFVLMLEGAVLFRSGLARKCQAQRLPQAAAPFAVRSSAAGYGSSDTSDAGARGEQWMPLWGQPSLAVEVAELLRTARSQIGGKIAERGTDMARSIARMGVSRGIQRFERYGYIERNGLSNLAVPLGRFDVEPKPNQDILDEAMPWLDRFRRLASDKNAPESFDRAYQACEKAVFRCATEGKGFLPLLVSMGAAEDQMIRSPKFSAGKHARPIPRLSARWIERIRSEEDGPEVGLALALAAQTGEIRRKGRFEGVRSHWLPLDGSYFDKSESSLHMGPEQSAFGLDLPRSLIAMLRRRLVAQSQGLGLIQGNSYIPLRLTHPGLGASPHDLRAFIEGRVDDAKILGIARGLMAVRAPDREERFPANPRDQGLGGLALYGILRLALPTGPVYLRGHADLEVRCNSLLFHRLRQGNLSAAFEVATRQLSMAGIRPRARVGVGSAQLSQRLAAAMGFGISPKTAARLALTMANPSLDGES